MKIKKLFQNLFKNVFYIIFKFFYGTINCNETLNSKDNINIHEIDNKNIISFFGIKYKVYQIRNGRIYNDNVQNVAIINNNNIIQGPSYQQVEGELKTIKHNICVKIGTPRVKKKFNGRVLNMAQGASGHKNYSHWLLDMLPKLKLYDEIFSFKDLNYIYLNKLENFQKCSLELLGLKYLKIIDSDQYRHIQCEDLISTDHPSYFNGFILDQAQNIPEWVVYWLRDSFLGKSEKIDCKEKVFIDRSGSSFKHSQIINYDQTINFLKDKGFEILKLEKKSFLEQVSIFYNAKVVVGAHGAGLANICFSKSKSRIIEIRSSEPGYAYQNREYERIAKINNLKYTLYSTPFINDKNLNGDLNVNIDKLNSYLND